MTETDRLQTDQLQPGNLIATRSGDNVLILSADPIIAVCRTLLADIARTPRPHARIHGDGSLITLTGLTMRTAPFQWIPTELTYRDTGRTWTDPDRSPLFELIDRQP